MGQHQTNKKSFFLNFFFTFLNKKALRAWENEGKSSSTLFFHARYRHKGNGAAVRRSARLDKGRPLFFFLLSRCFFSFIAPL
jgi:hypothetical protein